MIPVAAAPDAAGGGAMGMCAAGAARAWKAQVYPSVLFARSMLLGLLPLHLIIRLELVQAWRRLRRFSFTARHALGGLNLVVIEYDDTLKAANVVV